MFIDTLKNPRYTCCDLDTTIAIYRERRVIHIASETICAARRIPKVFDLFEENIISDINTKIWLYTG